MEHVAELIKSQHSSMGAVTVGSPESLTITIPNSRRGRFFKAIITCTNPGLAAHLLVLVQVNPRSFNQSMSVPTAAGESVMIIEMPAWTYLEGSAGADIIVTVTAQGGAHTNVQVTVFYQDPPVL